MKNKLIEIFKAGKHIASNGTEINFSAEDVADIAASYNPDLHEAPIVIGHPKDNSPAFGWIKELVCKAGNKVLQAMPVQLSADFVEAVNAGAYKKISASIYTKDSPNNPTPGHYYLRHVGFLGAQPPAIKGLAAVEFAENDQTLEMEFDFSETELAYNDKSIARVLRSLKNFLIGKFSQEEADSAINEWDIESLSSGAEHIVAKNKTDFAELEPETPKEEPAAADDPRTAELAAILETEKQKRLAAEAELSKIALQKKLAENADFCETRIKEGRLLPANKEKVLQVLNELSVAGVCLEKLAKTDLSFAEASIDFAKTNPVDNLKQMLSSLPVQVNFSEIAPTTANTKDLSDPEVLAAAAQKYQKEQAEKGNKLNFSEAVRALKG